VIAALPTDHSEILRLPELAIAPNDNPRTTFDASGSEWLL